MIHTRLVNGYKVETKAKTISLCNQLVAEAGTNGLQGGDAGHGCRTYIRIADRGGTGIRFQIDGDDELIITLAGDSELESIIKALRFIANRLSGQMEKSRGTV